MSGLLPTSGAGSTLLTQGGGQPSTTMLAAAAAAGGQGQRISIEEAEAVQSMEVSVNDWQCLPQSNIDETSHAI